MITNQLQHFPCNCLLFTIVYLWNDPFSHLPIWEFIFTTWATNINSLSGLWSWNCVLQAVPLWRSLLLWSQTGLGPPTLEESMGPWVCNFFLKLLSYSSAKWGVIKLKYWVVWSMKYKYKAFIMKSSPSRLLVLISLHWCLPCCFLLPYISLYLWLSTLVWDTAQFLCSSITFNHSSFILCLRIWERL